MKLQNLLSTIINNKRIAAYALRHMDQNILRKYLPRDFLSPLQQFASDGYNDLLTKNLQLTEDSLVIILGGYLGDSAQKYLEAYNCNLHIYEPILDHYNALQHRFDKNTKVSLFNCAVADSDSNLLMKVQGEKTGIYSEDGFEISVPCVDIVNAIKSFQSVDLIEMNIEGGEYQVLSRLIDTNIIENVKTIQVQFHNLSESHEAQRAMIRNKLRSTHKLVFDYYWIWERWTKI